jgi:hypothetical protein
VVFDLDVLGYTANGRAGGTGLVIVEY